MQIFSGFSQFCKNILYIIGLLFLLSTIHWGLIQFITIYCAPSGIWGPFINLFTIGSPICQLANSIQHKISEHYLVVITSVGTAITTWIVANLKS